jgi:hypothetical protein
VLYLIILIISGINLFRFQTNKKRLKKEELKQRDHMRPVRSLTTEESDALSVLHKTVIPSGAQVYQIKGNYRSSTMTMRSSEITAHYIDTFQLAWDPLFENFLLPENDVEVVFPSNNKEGLIITMNNKYNVVKEAKIRRALSEDDSHGNVGISTQNDTTFKKTRKLSDEEKRYLDSDLRLIVNLAIFTMILIITLAPMGWISYISAALLIPLLFHLLKNEYFLKNKNLDRNVITVSGILSRKEAPGSDKYDYSIDRFNLKFPPDWALNIRAGESLTIEGYALNKNSTTLSVLTLNYIQSVDRKEKDFPTVKAGKFIVLSAFLFLNLILFFTFAHGEEILSRTVFYTLTKNQPSDFTDYNEIEQFQFKEGQEIRFSNQRIYPMYLLQDKGWAIHEGNILLGNKENLVLDLSPVLERINNLKSLQLTEEMIYIAAQLTRDNLEFYSFLVKNTPLMNGLKITDHTPDFKDNQSFGRLRDVGELLLSETENDTELYAEDISDAYNYFFYYEQEILNKMIGKILSGALLNAKGIQINNPRDEYLQIDIKDRDLTVFYRKTSYTSENPFIYREDVPAESFLNSLNKQFLSYNEKTELTGILNSIKRVESSNREFLIRYNDQYTHIEELYFRTAVFLLILGLFLFFLYKTVTGIYRNKVESV